MAFALGFAIAAQVPATERNITFNGRKLTTIEMTRLELVERYYRVRILDRDYFYDDRSGAVGFWQGPVIAALPAGLGLGGPLPANASAGDTQVFVNGRELHVNDVMALRQFVPVYQGRYWVDGHGTFGVEGGRALGNLLQLARQSSQGNSGPRRVYAPGELSEIVVNSAGACTASGCAFR